MLEERKLVLGERERVALDRAELAGAPGHLCGQRRIGGHPLGLQLLEPALLHRRGDTRCRELEPLDGSVTGRPAHPVAPKEVLEERTALEVVGLQIRPVEMAHLPEVEAPQA